MKEVAKNRKWENSLPIIIDANLKWYIPLEMQNTLQSLRQHKHDLLHLHKDSFNYRKKNPFHVKQLKINQHKNEEILHINESYIQYLA